MKRNYLSFSALKAFAKSPNHYLQYIQDKPDSEAMAFGRAFHAAILEPEVYAEQFVIAPKVDRRTKDGKATWEEFVKLSQDKTVLTHEQAELIETMKAAVMGNQIAADLLKACSSYEDAREGTIAGVPFKAVADGVGGTWVLDIKTCQDASPEGFERTAHNSMYHEQAAIYQAIFNCERFYWIAVEKDAPYNVAVYAQDADANRKALRRVVGLAEKFQEWDGEPRGYFDGIATLNLPRWA